MGVVHLWEELLCMTLLWIALLWIALPRMALMMSPRWHSTPVFPVCSFWSGFQDLEQPIQLAVPMMGLGEWPPVRRRTQASRPLTLFFCAST